MGCIKLPDADNEFQLKYFISVDIRIPKDPSPARTAVAGWSFLPSVRHRYNLRQTGLLNHQGNTAQNCHIN